MDALDSLDAWDAWDAVGCGREKTTECEVGNVPRFPRAADLVAKGLSASFPCSWQFSQAFSVRLLHLHRRRKQHPANPVGKAYGETPSGALMSSRFCREP